MTDYTTVKLTETEVRALFKWLQIGQEQEFEIVDYDDGNAEAKARYKALANIEKKLEKEGWK
jgi:hypothetical protein